MKELIEQWLKIHEDNTVRIVRKGDDIVAHSNYNCRGEFIGVEYIEYVVSCPCCEGDMDIYYSFENIDFSNCQLVFEDSSGAEVKMHDVKNKATTWSLKTELSQQEINDFFDNHWDSVCSWTEGEGRGQSNYEIMKGRGGTRIVSVEHYGCDDFMQPKYFALNN